MMREKKVDSPAFRLQVVSKEDFSDVDVHTDEDTLNFLSSDP
jgi:hypothetical protein